MRESSNNANSVRAIDMFAVVFTDKDELLDFLNEEQAESPEDFLARMEDALEQGVLTEDEVILLMKDFISCK